MSLIVKKKMYASGGIFVIIAMLLAVTYAKRFFISRLVEEYIPWISGIMVLWFLYLLFMVAFIAFVVNVYRLETSRKYSTTTRDDFLKILKPTLGNIIFWLFIIFLNFIAFMLER